MSTRVFAGAAPFSPKAANAELAGLYRLDDGAEAWRKLAGGLPERAEVRAVAIHPTEPDVVFAGAQDGPYRSTDGGDTWRRPEFPDPGLPVWSFAFHPDDASVLYCGVGPAGVWRSTDGGESWSVLPAARQEERLQMGFPTRLISLAIDPSYPDWIYAGVEVGGVIRSTDGGETWTDVTGHLAQLGEEPRLRSKIGSDTEIEGMLDTHALAVSAAQPGVPFLAVRMGLFRSDDHGETWRDLEVGRFSPLTYARDVVVSPHDPRRLYACLSVAALSDEGSLWCSDDVGETWRRFDKVAPRSTMMRCAPHPRDPQQVWCATRKGEVFATLDGGGEWLERPLPAGASDVYALACG